MGIYSYLPKSRHKLIGITKIKAKKSRNHTELLSKYLKIVLIPFLIAIFPIFSGVTPSTLWLALKLLSKFPSFEPISIIKSFRYENLKHQRLITKAFRKRDLSSPLNELIVTIVMLVIVWFGGILVIDPSNNSTLTGPQFLGFILIFSQLDDSVP